MAYCPSLVAGARLSTQTWLERRCFPCFLVKDTRTAIFFKLTCLSPSALPPEDVGTLHVTAAGHCRALTVDERCHRCPACPVSHHPPLPV
jgi:hypothetical protein